MHARQKQTCYQNVIKTHEVPSMLGVASHRSIRGLDGSRASLTCRTKGVDQQKLISYLE